MKQSKIGWIAFIIIFLIVGFTVYFKLRSSPPIKEITPPDTIKEITEPSMKDRWEGVDCKKC